MRKFAVTVAILLCAGTATAQGLPTDPSLWLGMTFSQFMSNTPHDCKQLRAFDLDHAGRYSVHDCKIKHHVKWITPGGAKVETERVVFRGGRVAEIDFTVAHKMLGERYQNEMATVNDLTAVYGVPDPPKELESGQTFRSNTFGGANRQVTVGSQGKSQTLISTWTHPAFSIRWTSFTYESYSSMVEEDTNPLAGILGMSFASKAEQVAFIDKSTAFNN